MAITEEALSRRQRNIKQPSPFLHKDSADLLPLDALKKLGTSKEWQPHNVLQKKLLRATLSRNRLNNRNMKLLHNHTVQSHSMHRDTQEAELDLIQVLIQAKIISNKNEDLSWPLQHNLQTIGHIKLSLIIGQTETDLLFAVVETNRMFISLGTKTLKFLKCVIDTEKQMLVLGNSVREQIHFVGKDENEVSME